MKLLLLLPACGVITFLFSAVNAVRDVTDCASDPSYAATLMKIATGQNKGSWKDWMVVPTYKTSAYGICYYNALRNVRFNVGQSVPLPETLMPMCRTLSPHQNSNQTGYDPRIKGFECTCPDPTTRQELKILNKYSYSCPNPACVKCRTDRNYECEDGKCKCRKGYTERMMYGIAQCVLRECGPGESYPPQLIKSGNTVYVKCDTSTFRYVPAYGYRLIRDNVTNAVIDAVGINEYAKLCYGACRTDRNFECVDRKCRCKKGFTQLGNHAFCVQSECGPGEALPRQLIAKKHQSNVKCDLSNSRYAPVSPGYRLVRNNLTNVVIDAVDINECLEMPDVCCENESKCRGPNCAKCFNVVGTFICKTEQFACDVSRIDKKTCKCK